MNNMPTRILTVDSALNLAESIREAAGVLKAGGLVAFPTETVYGLGADGLNPHAVAKVYAAKGRPSRNPLILHVADIGSAVSLVADWSAEAARLTSAFWPGPLTLVLPRSHLVPDIVTAGQPTVAIRCPAHAIAKALLAECQTPIAAPSANRSSELSPTLPEHVLKTLNGRIDLLIAAGATSGGIESTIIDLSSAQPRLLRPGILTVQEIESVIGPVVLTNSENESGALPAPGMMARHYAPHTPMQLALERSDLVQIYEKWHEQGKIAAVLTLGNWLDVQPPSQLIEMPILPAHYARVLFSTLHTIDLNGFSSILIEFPPDQPEWLAIRDRLKRAACPDA